MLTARQKEVLDFIRRFRAERGFPPTLREICACLGIRGPKNAKKHLDALERKGFIRRRPGLSRGIDLLGGREAVLPVAGRVEAGLPHLAEEDIVGRVAFEGDLFNSTGAFLLRVEGESMTGAGLEPGDIIFVDPSKEARDGDIVVAVVDGEATVKRLFREKGKVVLRSENPAFGPIYIEKGRPFHIAGKVVFLMKRIG